MTTPQIVALAATGMGLVDAIVGQSKLTGRAKNVVHLIMIGALAALKALADALTANEPPPPPASPKDGAQ